MIDGRRGVGIAWPSLCVLKERLSRAEEEAMLLAGEVRSAACVNLLLNRIHLRQTLTILSRIPHSFMFGRPAYDALVKIGLPAVNPTLARLPYETSRPRRMLMVALLRSCLGPEGARIRLSDLAVGELTPDRRRRVDSALADLDGEGHFESRLNQAILDAAVAGARGPR